MFSKFYKFLNFFITIADLYMDRQIVFAKYLKWNTIKAQISFSTKIVLCKLVVV